MGRAQRSHAVTAGELIAELARDEEFQAQQTKRDVEQEERYRGLRVAEAPIVADLRGAGVDVASAWDLVNTNEPYPLALPVLVEHLERGGYPDRVMEGLGRALAVKPAVAYWDRLKACYLLARGPEETGGIAVA